MLVIDNITDKESKYNRVKTILSPHYYVYWLYLISCLYANTFAQLYVIKEMTSYDPFLSKGMKSV